MFYVKSKNLKVPIKTSDEVNYDVCNIATARVCKRKQIPPLSEEFVLVNVPSGIDVGSTVLVTPVPDRMVEYPVAKSIHVVDKTKIIPVRIANLNSTQMLVQKRTNLAQIQEIDVQTMSVSELAKETGIAMDNDFVKLFDFSRLNVSQKSATE